MILLFKMKSYRLWTRFFCTSFNRFDFNFRKNSRVFSHFSGDFEPESWKSMKGLLRCSANYVPLSPISFLERAAKVYRDRTSVIYGSVKYSWSETYERCLRLASALTDQLGISRGDVVATLAPNVPAMYELHFAVPMAGAVLCTLNARLDSNMVYVLLKHSEAKVIFVDYQLLDIARSALDCLAKTEPKLPMLVSISESEGWSPTGLTSNTYEYESLLASGHNEFEIRRPKSEWDPISINYTSGTTSRPKGVVYSHRGAYLNSLSTVFLHGIGAMPVYLWNVPMFHCNGWCLIWGLAAQGGTNICLRKVCPKDIFASIVQYKVTNMGGAPTVLNMIAGSPVCDRKPLPHKVEVMTGGAPPPPQILSKMEELGFGVSHLYGLTETYGPGTYCAWKPEWDSLLPDERLKLKTRQGVHHLGLQDVDVKDSVTEESVPHYMAPRTVVFEDLPRTSTGKVQKFILREKAKAIGRLFELQ